MSYGEEKAQSPFTRPGFVAAAVVVAVIITLGIVLAVWTSRDDEPAPGAAATEPAATAQPSADPVADETESICGLDGVELEGTLTSPPGAEWAYQGTVPYPTSSTYGPGETTSGGARYCFQHSPAGALFMAANAVAQGSDPATSREWASRALADGPYRDGILEQMVGGSSSSEGTRLTLKGFRILNYDGRVARIDVGAEVSADGQTVTMSAVYELVWQDGDWKISTDVQTPLDAASIPDLAGYVSWGE